MKVQKVEDSKCWFNPIHLTVTIESESELIALWHRLNITWAGVENSSHSPPQAVPKFGVTTKLWELLDDIARAREVELYRQRG